MWIWECELRKLGLRLQSTRYWKCERRYGLPTGTYLSVFCNASEREAATGPTGRKRVDLSAFHVTFCLGMDCIHFYYHEWGEDSWEPGGHTSGSEIRRHNQEPAELCAVADAVAAEFLAALGMMLLPRETT